MNPKSLLKENKKQKIKRIERGLAKEPQIKLFCEIAKKPASFTELLNKGIVSRGVLAKHLKKMEMEDFIYRDIVKKTETSNHSEVGKIVYKIKEDEMQEFIMQTVQMNFMFADLVENVELQKKLRMYAEEIAKAMIQYVNMLIASREQSLKAELERIKKK